MPRERRRLRIRGAPRKDIDLHLLAQALLIIDEELREAAAAQEHATSTASEESPERENET